MRVGALQLKQERPWCDVSPPQGSRPAPSAAATAGGAFSPLRLPTTSYRAALAQLARVRRQTRQPGEGGFSSRSLPQNSRALDADRSPEQPFGCSRQRAPFGWFRSALHLLHQAQCCEALAFVPDVIAVQAHQSFSVRPAGKRPNRQVST